MSWMPWVLVALVVAASGVLLLWLYGDREAATARIEQSDKAASAAQSRLTAIEQERSELGGAVERLERENEELISIKVELSQDVQAKEEELERLKSTYQDLEEKMRAEIEEGDIRLTQVGGKLQVGLVDKILFKSGEAEISKRGEKVLEKVGQVLATVRDRAIQVSGHTDDSPPGKKIQDQFPTNWELSVARATNVVRFLAETAGVPGKSLSASGHGKFRPIATNATARGRARNRRIEILLVPIIQPVKVDKPNGR